MVIQFIRTFQTINTPTVTWQKNKSHLPTVSSLKILATAITCSGTNQFRGMAGTMDSRPDVFVRCEQVERNSTTEPSHLVKYEHPGVLE